MRTRFTLAVALLIAVMLSLAPARSAWSCCPSGPVGKPVVNADQTIVIVWDEANKTQHFIRKASFKAESDDVGFLVPSPSNPELDESGNEAFDMFAKLTEPEIKKVPRGSGGGGFGCSRQAYFEDAAMPAAAMPVEVLQAKEVAGFHAVVLEAKSATALNDWLKKNGYANSPEIEAWAKPYVDAGWKITAMKIAKDKDAIKSKEIKASALRMSFKTDRPLFPYREPDYKGLNEKLDQPSRLLRIFFVADARFRGELTKDQAWTGQVAWAGKLAAKDREKVLGELKLPGDGGPREWYLTEFEDQWPYKVAPADVYFSRDKEQKDVRRPPIIQYVQAPATGDGTLATTTILLGVASAASLMIVRRGRI